MPMVGANQRYQFSATSFPLDRPINWFYLCTYSCSIVIDVCCRFVRPHSEQLSEPYHKGAHSKSLRDVFEKAILRGDVPVSIQSPGLYDYNPQVSTTHYKSAEKLEKYPTTTL